MKRLLARTAQLAVALGLAGGAAPAQEALRIGVVTTLTTPGAALGEEQRNGYELALEHMDGTIAGRPVELVYEDDGFRPEVGKQAADRLVLQERVPIVTGFVWSNVLLASYKSVLDGGAFLISANAGPAQLAGENCHENFFNVSWQNDQTPMALGEILNRRGVGSLYIMAPNYAAGKQISAGVNRTFEGEILGQDLTKWGADAQLDFSAELAKAKASGAEALWAFYPGRAGAAFLGQFVQAGLGDSMELYTSFTIDEISLPRFQEADLEGVIGSLWTQTWAPDLDTPENLRFVEDFKAAHGREPSFYAAQAYDSLFFIKAAVEAAGGDVEDADALRAAMEAVTYLPTRGNVAVGANHFLIQDFYLREAIVGEDGNWTSRIVSTVYEDHVDPYAGDCRF